MKTLLIALIFPFLTIYSQKNSDSQKLILKKVKILKRNFEYERSLEYKDAYQFLLDNFSNSIINYSDLNSYCQTVSVINKKLGVKIREIKTKKLIESQSEGFFKLFFYKFSKFENDSINKMSDYWNNSRRLKKDNYWVDENNHIVSMYYDSIFPRIFPYYYNQLRKSTNKQQQNQIVDECMRSFQEIDTYYDGLKLDFLTRIIGGMYLESSWPNGEIHLYNFSYLHDYLEQAGENDQLKNLGDWLEPEKGIYNPYSVITKEKIKFKNGKFIDTLTSYKNDLIYSEIIFSSNKRNLGQLKQINCFDNSGEIVRSRFFEYRNKTTNNSYSKTYEYHFRDWKNEDLANLDKSIQTIENLLESFSGDEALKKINDCKNDFPINLQQNVKLNELNQKAIQVNNSKQQIDSNMTKCIQLIAVKKYREALDVLNSTKNLISNDFNTEFEQYNVVLNQISEAKGNR